jgi:hypothetical protein
LSPLTKLFVSLMIVCSLLLTGGVVVFLNKVEDYRKALVARDADCARLADEAATNKSRADAAANRELAAARDANNRLADMQKTLDTVNAEKLQLMGEKNKASNDATVKDAQVQTMVQTVSALKDSLNDLLKRYDGIVKDLDNIRNRNTELVAGNNDLQKKFDEAERERKFANERIVQLTSDLAKAKEQLATLVPNYRWDQGTIAARPQADLKGVVRGVKTQDGVVFATISIGSSDTVAKGMKFMIINGNTDTYLGTITLQTVEATESFGRIDGPRVNEIREGNIVRPQPGF